jgi:hypothetical protein
LLYFARMIILETWWSILIQSLDPVLGSSPWTGSKLIHLTLSSDLFVWDVISDPPIRTGLDFKSSHFDPILCFTSDLIKWSGLEIYSSPHNQIWNITYHTIYDFPKPNYNCLSVPDAPLQLFCKLTEPTIISIQWSPPPINPFVYPIQEYILQSNTGKNSGWTMFITNFIYTRYLH